MSEKPLTLPSGRKPISTVAMPMVVMVTRNATLRPLRSPNRPNTRAPKGRAKKPTAKVASARMKPVASLTPV